MSFKFEKMWLKAEGFVDIGQGKAVVVFLLVSRLSQLHFG